ncbi:MAG: polysaccharide biosynthesis tyrosine autokinase, partial [Opitutales bacterium]
KAVPPLNPSSPNIPYNLAAGFFGGIAAGFGLVFLVAFFDDRIKSEMDIEGALGISILGILPRLKKMSDTDKAKVVAGDSDFQVTETYRSIYSALKLNKEGSQAQVIMTTSTLPSEGKSFVSSNLALTFSSHGERTLLLDCDLRLPNVAKSLGLKNDNGLIQVLDGSIAVDDAIQQSLYPGFDVLPTGGKSSQSTQLLNSPTFAQLLNELRQNYDRILIDCPPLAAVSDALNIVSLTDGIIYVIKYNTVKQASAALNIERINKSETPILGALLNDVSGTGSGYYYSQYTNSQYGQYA